MSDTTTATIARLSTSETAFHQRLDALQPLLDGAELQRHDPLLRLKSLVAPQARLDETRSFHRLTHRSAEAAPAAPAFRHR